MSDIPGDRHTGSAAGQCPKLHAGREALPFKAETIDELGTEREESFLSGWQIGVTTVSNWAGVSRRQEDSTAFLHPKKLKSTVDGNSTAMLKARRDYWGF